MELWIRSQNKEYLIMIKKLDVFDRNIMINAYQDVSKGIRVPVMIIGNDNVNLGSYETKVRALEVLDEIQKNILYMNETVIEKQNEEGSDFTLHNFSNVYEMPKE